MVKFVTIPSGTDRQVSTFTVQREQFTLTPAVLITKQVTVAGTISDPSKVRVKIDNFTELKNSAIFLEPNFKVIGNVIIFDDVDLFGGIPPAQSIMFVSYTTEVLEDILIESPDIKISSSFDETTNDFRIGAWLHENGQISTAVSCDVTLYNFGTAVFSLLGITPDAEGIFYAFNNGSVLIPSGLYVVKVSITTATKVYTQASEVRIISTGADATSISDAVWNANRNNFNIANSMGRLSRDMFQALVGKYIIDFTANTLTIYAEDNVTPIRVFNLFDRSGKPATINIYERVPQ